MAKPKRLKASDIIERYGRPCTLLIPDLKADEGDPHGSWLGHVAVAAPDETWPEFEGQPLAPIAQLRLDQMPFVPEELRDLQIITVFVQFEEGHVGQAFCSGQPGSWILRSYASAADLVEIERPDGDFGFDGVPLTHKLVEKDTPDWQDVSDEIDDDLWPKKGLDREFRARVGGWPELVQSEICWAPHNKHPANPKFAFQIDSDPDLNLWIGDAGNLYFGRGTGEHRDQWAMEWQCH